MAVELDHVRAFLAIVRRGGFTRASASLHLSQPAISRRIRLLERQLGAALFERIHGGALLTDAGRAFLPHAEALFASMRDGMDAVEALRGTSRGNVTLAIVGTLASTSLTERLRRFRDAHPGVDLRIQTALSAEVSDLVRRGDATLGLRYELDPHPDLVASRVHDEPMVPVCSPYHRLATARRVEPAALAGEQWLAFPARPGAVREPYSAALEASTRWLRSRRLHDRADRQPHGAEAHGRGRLRSGAAAGQQLPRRTAFGGAARAGRRRPARDDSGRVDPSPARVSERSNAGADGDARRLATKAVTKSSVSRNGASPLAHEGAWGSTRDVHGPDF